MKKRSVCSLNYKKSFKSDHMKSVKHQEKIDQYYCKKWNLYMHRLDKFIYLNSNEQKYKNNKIGCEECSKYISDTTRHFRSEIHLRNKQNTQPNQQNNFSLDTQSASGTQHPSVQFDNNVEVIMNENTYIKLKINATENLVYHKNDL